MGSIRHGGAITAPLVPAEVGDKGPRASWKSRWRGPLSQGGGFFSGGLAQSSGAHQ